MKKKYSQTQPQGFLPITCSQFVLRLPSHQILPSVFNAPHSSSHARLVRLFALLSGSVSPRVFCVPCASCSSPEVPPGKHLRQGVTLPFLHALNTVILNGREVEHYEISVGRAQPECEECKQGGSAATKVERSSEGSGLSVSNSAERIRFRRTR